MICRRCRSDLGEGLLPARCPVCGANLANLADACGSSASAKQAAERRAQIVDVTKRERALQFRPGRLVFAGVFIVSFLGAVFYFVWHTELFGGVTVPDVVGWQVTRATQSLEQSGFSVTATPRVCDQPSGFVLSTNPGAGERIARGSAVVVTVSRQRAMPDLVGKTVDDAKRMLADLGVYAEIANEVSDKPAGVVLSLGVAPDTILTAGQIVKITVARSPKVPTVMGKTEQEATEALSLERLQVQVVKVSDPSRPAGTVVKVEPAEGTDQAVGTTVTLSVTVDKKQNWENSARDIIRIIYDCDPVVDANKHIGSALRRHLAPGVVENSMSDVGVWYRVVKRKDPGAELKPFDTLSRSLVGPVEVTAADNGTVVAKFTVKWHWTRMGERYQGVVSQDTRSVTMKFDDGAKLISLFDSQTDVPYYEAVDVSSQSASEAGAA